jgi:hypothetical protein
MAAQWGRPLVAIYGPLMRAPGDRIGRPRPFVCRIRLEEIDQPVIAMTWFEEPL